MVKKEKFIEWVSVSVPKSYYDTIKQILRREKSYSSVSEYVREVLRKDLRKRVGLKK